MDNFIFAFKFYLFAGLIFLSQIRLKSDKYQKRALCRYLGNMFILGSTDGLRPTTS